MRRKECFLFVLVTHVTDYETLSGYACTIIYSAGGFFMTRQEAEAIIQDLTEEQKIKLYWLLSSLPRNPSPSAPDQESDQSTSR